MLKRLLMLGLMFAAAPGPMAGAEALSAMGAEDRLIIGFQPGTDAAQRRRIAESYGLRVLREIPKWGLMLAQAEPHRSQAARAGLQGLPEVFQVDHDVWRRWIDAAPLSMREASLPSLEGAGRELSRFRPRGRAAQDDPGAGPAAGEAQWGVRRVNAPAAWPSNQGAGVKVGIVDTGIDPDNPDLRGQVAGGHNSIDEQQPWKDDHFHGTHVAGIVAAKLDELGVAGVAPKASLYAVKVLTKEGSGSLFGILDGILWCAENGMQVVNMSLGAEQGNPLFQYAIQAAHGAGVTIVAAAGNNGGAVGFPAAYEEAVAVSALDTEDKIASFSSRGPEIDFIAPGVKVPSTVPLSHDPSGIKAYSGTSMATPHVAGLAALAVARGAQGPAAVRAALNVAAEKISALRPEEQGAGVINAAKLAR